MKTQLILNSVVRNVNFSTVPSLPSAAAWGHASVCVLRWSRHLLLQIFPWLLLTEVMILIWRQGISLSHLLNWNCMHRDWAVKCRRKILWQSLLVGSSPFKTAKASKLTESQRKDLKTHLNDWPISGLSVVANYKNILCAFSDNLILLP